MLFSNPRVLPALLLCIGFGLAGYRYMELQRMPQWSEDDIALAVELNYALDLSRAEQEGKAPPDAQQRIDDKKAIREEIHQYYLSARDDLETQINQGLIGGLVGIFLYIGVLILQRRGVIK